MKIVYTLDTIDDVASDLIENVKSRTLLLYGGMGAGKTTLIKAIVNALGSIDEVSSPTFSIVNEYEVKNALVYHFDLYRVNDLEETYNFGIEDYLDSCHWKIIEWPEIIEPILSEDFDRIDIEVNDENSRILRVNYKMNLTKN